MTREVSETGLSLIKSFEELRLEPYLDTGGVPTIGYGHTRGVTMQTKPITELEADTLLRDDLQHAETEVCRIIRVSLNENQYAALVSLVFNAGTAPLLKTLGLRLNAGDYDNAAQQILLWDHVAGQISHGLTNRRNAEYDLFTTNNGD